MPLNAVTTSLRALCFLFGAGHERESAFSAPCPASCSSCPCCLFRLDEWNLALLVANRTLSYAGRVSCRRRTSSSRSSPSATRHHRFPTRFYQHAFDTSRNPPLVLQPQGPPILPGESNPAPLRKPKTGLRAECLVARPLHVLKQGDELDNAAGLLAEHWNDDQPAYREAPIFFPHSARPGAPQTTATADTSDPFAHMRHLEASQQPNVGHEQHFNPLWVQAPQTAAPAPNNGYLDAAKKFLRLCIEQQRDGVIVTWQGRPFALAILGDRDNSHGRPYHLPMPLGHSAIHAVALEDAEMLDFRMRKNGIVVEHFVMKAQQLPAEVKKMASHFAQRVVLHGSWNRLMMTNRPLGSVATVVHKADLSLHSQIGFKRTLTLSSEAAIPSTTAFQLSRLHQFPSSFLYSASGAFVQAYIVDCIDFEGDGQSSARVIVQKLKSFVDVPHRHKLRS